jgi:rubrerythrin
MTSTRLFAKLRALIEDTTNTDKKHIRKLRKVLRKLKDRQNTLRESLEETDNPQERRKIEQELEVLNLQRSKGAEVYKQLKQARKLANEGERDTTTGDGNKNGRKDFGSDPQPR